MGNKTSMEYIVALGVENKCTLVSKEYRDIRTGLNWGCDTCLHVFTKTLATVKLNGLKCPKCNPKIPHNKGRKGVPEETRIKMSLAKRGKAPPNKGKSMGDPQKVKLSCVNQGIDLSDFTGFKTEEARKLRVEFEQHPVRQECLVKHSYTCVYCDTVGGVLHVHHLNSWKFFADERFNIDNLTCVCYGCHRSFHHIYGNGKKTPNTREQFESFLNTKKGRAQTIYMVAGAPGAGKSWVCEQLKHKFTYIPMDISKNMLNYTLYSSDNDMPFLIDPTTNVSTYRKRLLQKHKVHLITILEDESVVRSRLENRNGKFTQSVARRVKRMKSLSRLAMFSGTSEEVLEYLSNKKSPVI